MFNAEELKQLKEAVREVVREELGLGQNKYDPYQIQFMESDPRFVTIAAVAAILPGFYFVVNLNWENAKTEAEKAFIRTNCGTDENGRIRDKDGNPIPIYGQLFAQADTWISDGVREAVSPNVKDVKETVMGWVRDEDKNFPAPEWIKHPIKFAARIESWDTLIEWARRSAPGFASAGGNGSGFLRP